MLKFCIFYAIRHVLAKYTCKIDKEEVRTQEST